MNSQDLNNLRALMNLLDDPDKEIFEHIKSQIFSYGIDAIEILEHEWETTPDVSTQSIIENIIHIIQLNHTKEDLLRWRKDPNQNLLQAFLILTDFQYPGFNQESALSQIKEIKDAIWLELNNNLTALEKTKVINHILFKVYKLHGSESATESIPATFLNNLLETKTGAPLAMSMLYLSLAKELELPIYGILLPNNLILAYSRHFLNNPALFDDSLDEIMFYINPFKNGAIFTKNEIDLYLQQIKVDPQPSFYSPCSVKDILLAFLGNLILLFEHDGQVSKAEEVQELLAILKQ